MPVFPGRAVAGLREIGLLIILLIVPVSAPLAEPLGTPSSRSRDSRVSSVQRVLPLYRCRFRLVCVRDHCLGKCSPCILFYLRSYLYWFGVGSPSLLAHPGLNLSHSQVLPIMLPALISLLWFLYRPHNPRLASLILLPAHLRFLCSFATFLGAVSFCSLPPANPPFLYLSSYPLAFGSSLFSPPSDPTLTTSLRVA